ncbi:single-stranded DNA-binding protein [Sphingobacterium siyangense]|uniref:single-stranded DNA-binding protein n=1 Tax=Sphingobacterium siyangense TaxID=459529 RepID=UPI003DA24F2F
MNIIGRLTGDAKVSTLQNSREVVNFSVAVNDSYKKKDGERVQLTEYFDCAYFLSPKVADSLTKGTLVEVTGRVSTRAWLGRDGQPHVSLNFHTSNIKFLDSPKKAERPEIDLTAKDKGKAKTDEKEDLPF